MMNLAILINFRITLILNCAYSLISTYIDIEEIPRLRICLIIEMCVVDFFSIGLTTSMVDLNLEIKVMIYSIHWLYVLYQEI